MGRRIERRRHGTEVIRADYDRRIVWMFRREVAPDGLIHYHAIVKFPVGRTWRDETPGQDGVMVRCQRLQRALMDASKRTPEPYGGTQVDLRGADIDVRPYNRECDHAGYTLKAMWRYTPEWVTDDTVRDSGLIILPHLPKPGTKKKRKRKNRRQRNDN